MSAAANPEPVHNLFEPLPWLALAAIAGRLLAARATLRLPGLLLLAAGAWFWIRLAPVTRAWARWVVPLTALVASGITLAGFLPAECQAGQLDGTAVALSGRIIAAESGAYGTRAVLRQPGGIRVQLFCDPVLAAGCQISVTARLERPAGARNPGGFDNAAYLASQGIFLQAYALADPPLAVIRDAPDRPLAHGLDRVRAAVRRALARLLAPEQAALMAALLVGDTDGLSEAQRFDFAQSGLAHLTAVSGLHLTMLLQPLVLLLGRLPLCYRARGIVQMIFLGFFGCLTGWRVSVTRAIVMTVAQLAGKLMLRPTSPPCLLALALLVLTCCQPFAVLGSAFWMSAAATAALIFLAEPLAARLGRLLPPALARLLAVGLATQLATLPWNLALNHAFQLASLPVNGLAMPLAGGALCLGLALLPLGWIGLPAVAAAAGRPLALLLTGLGELAAWTARLRAGRLYSGWLNPCLLLAILLLALGLWPAWRRLALKASLVLLLAGLAWQGIAWLVRPPVQVWFFDVGQGDAILIRARQGGALLIDGGKPGQGTKTLIPALNALGIARVRLSVVTHGDQDHAGGLAELAEYGCLDTLLIGQGLFADAASQAAAAPALAALLEAGARRHLTVQTVAVRDTIALGCAAKLQVLAPPDDPAVRTEARRDGNAWSLILQAELAGSRFLFTGDCTPAGERRLNASGWPQADVLKVAHHGAALTTGTAMLEQVRPAAAVISVGSNSYGHPDPRVLKRLADQGCLVLSTRTVGAVRFDCRSGQLTVRAMNGSG